MLRTGPKSSILHSAAEVTYMHGSLPAIINNQATKGKAWRIVARPASSEMA